VTGRSLLPALLCGAFLAAASAADAHKLSQSRAQEAGQAAVQRKYRRVATFPPVVFCPYRRGHVHKFRCNYEFGYGGEICDGFVSVRFRSRTSRKLRFRITRAYCGVPGAPSHPI
jgi:hypothetical protein